MKINLYRNKSGFSLVEALMALGVGLTFLATVISLWVFSGKNWKVQSAKTEIRFDIQEAMEKIKRDAGLSDGGKILFYPSGETSYTAISIPAATPNGSGFLTFSGSTISWDKTIIYHVYENELRRTVIDSFNSTTATRQTQLDNVAASGEDANGTTTTLFSADSATFEITPSSASFDGYSATLSRGTNTNFGTISLAAGNHTIQFKVNGKNASSSGYRLGIDQISLTPSGGPQEAEDLTVSADTGQTKNTEDMSSYSDNGAWGGNYQMEYQASAVNNYITFQTYYDQWLESNFDSMTHSNTEVTGTNPKLAVASRETQGLIPGWRSSTQTGVTSADNDSSGATPDPAINNKTIRDIILGASITKAGQMVRLKFVASSAGPLTITNAYFGARSGYNFVAGTSSQLYFNNGTVVEGEDDGVGATGAAGPTTITIPAGEHAWTNWFIPSSAIAYPSATDYLVSFAVDAAAASADESYWAPGSGTHSYMETGSTASSTWTAMDPGYTTDSSIHAVEEIAVWNAAGTATSQIYDTTLSTPAYSQISWTETGAGTYLLKARSSSNSDMTGATDWSAIAGSSASPAALSIGAGRYAQFQATLTAASPYTTYPELDKVKITWPGQTSLVQVDGYYTKRPNYGTFTVLVDGAAITKALNITLQVEKEVQDKTYDYSLSATIDCRNTGK